MKKIKIILAEDDESLIATMAQILRSKGYEVIEARDGEKLIELVTQEKPHLIVTDYMMPKIDGLTCRERIMENSELQEIPFVLISAVNTTEVMDRAKTLGVTRFIVKPFGISKFISAIKNIFE